MRHQPSLAVVAVTVMVFLAGAGAAIAQPSLADARGAFAAKDYRACLQKVAGALNGPEGKPESAARYDLLMLRGEAMVQLGDRRLAGDAFNQAAMVAKSKEDRARRADAMAAALLVTAAKGNKYAPKSGAAEIDIADIQSRKAAYTALLADRLAVARPKIEKAAASESIKDIREELPEVRDLYALELAATGEGTETLPLARSLGERARSLMTAEFKRIDGRLDQLEASASTPVLLADVMTPKGLSSPERDEVKAIAQSLTECEKAGQQGRWISKHADGPTAAWETLLADCSELKERAQQLWDRRH